MNKKEISNLNNLIKMESRSYFYGNDSTILKTIERTCNYLEYQEFYRVANREILKEMKENNIINHICYDTIIKLFNNIERVFQIALIIDKNLLIGFYNDIELINDEIKFVNEEIYNENCKMLNVIYNHFLVA